MGSDSFENLDKWKNADVLKKKYPIIVYQRPGHLVDLNVSREHKPLVLQAPLLEISATMIRKNISQGKSIRYLVPEKVR